MTRNGRARVSTSRHFALEERGPHAQIGERVRKRTVIRGFAVGLLLGLFFVAFRLFKYGSGGSRSELPIYVAAILSFGVVGAILGWIADLIRERLRKK